MKATSVIKSVSAGIIFGALLCGCEPEFTLKDFKSENGIGLIIKGTPVLTYDEKRFQTGYNKEKNTFWVTDDNMADYFILTCRSFPEAGSSVTGSLKYTTETDVKNRQGTSFEVISCDYDSGIIKLWNDSGKIGVIVSMLF